MRQYMADLVELNWFGLDLKPGLAAGTFITEARNAPSWTQKPSGARPRVVRVFNPDRSGTVSVVVDQESAEHQRLRQLAAQDRATRSIVGVMTMKDGASGETVYYRNAYIQTEPDETRGVESATFTWVFLFEDVEKIPSIDQNLVGS